MKTFIRFIFCLMVCLGARAQSGTHVQITLGNIGQAGITPSAFRNIQIQQMSVPTANSGSVIIGGILPTNTDVNGQFTLSNCPVPMLYMVKVMAPPAQTVFQFYAYTNGLGLVQASALLVANSAATFPAGAVAWSASTSDQRYQPIGGGGGGTNGVAVAAGTLITTSTNLTGSTVTVNAVSQTNGFSPIVTRNTNGFVASQGGNATNLTMAGIIQLNGQTVLGSVTPGTAHYIGIDSGGELNSDTFIGLTTDSLTEGTGNLFWNNTRSNLLYAAATNAPLNGNHILSGTINSNRLDAATQAQLALANGATTNGFAPTNNPGLFNGTNWGDFHLKQTVGAVGNLWLDDGESVVFNSAGDSGIRHNASHPGSGALEISNQGSAAIAMGQNYQANSSLQLGAFGPFHDNIFLQQDIDPGTVDLTARGFQQLFGPSKTFMFVSGYTNAGSKFSPVTGMRGETIDQSGTTELRIYNPITWTPFNANTTYSPGTLQLSVVNNGIKVPNSISGGSMVVTNSLTNLSLTASQFIATDANKSLVSTLNGSTLTSLSGGNITAGTVSSNALDAPTKAQLALAGSGGGGGSGNYLTNANSTPTVLGTNAFIAAQNGRGTNYTDGGTIVSLGNITATSGTITGNNIDVPNNLILETSTINAMLYANGSRVVTSLANGGANTVLHGSTAPTYSKVDLTADVTGNLAVNTNSVNGASVSISGLERVTGAWTQTNETTGANVQIAAGNITASGGFIGNGNGVTSLATAANVTNLNVFSSNAQPALTATAGANGANSTNSALFTTSGTATTGNPVWASIGIQGKGFSTTASTSRGLEFRFINKPLSSALGGTGTLALDTYTNDASGNPVSLQANAISINQVGTMTLNGSVNSGSAITANGNVSAGSGANIGFSSRSLMFSSADARIELKNNNNNAFSDLYANLIVATNSIIITNGLLILPQTLTGSGTTGNQTINKPAGSVRIAAAGSTVTVTDSYVTANSIVVAVVRSNDTTALVKNVVPGAGSFVINMNAAVTAETDIAFMVMNQ